MNDSNEAYHQNENEETLTVMNTVEEKFSDMDDSNEAYRDNYHQNENEETLTATYDLH
ncbi:7138_t:CDS:2 [Gigaspora rosea]|nr:7138_t:CDS:2 [Gigaspora rosea]